MTCQSAANFEAMRRQTLDKGSQPPIRQSVLYSNVGKGGDGKVVSRLFVTMPRLCLGRFPIHSLAYDRKVSPIWEGQI
jgi:hypothetical protein